MRCVSPRRQVGLAVVLASACAACAAPPSFTVAGTPAYLFAPGHPYDPARYLFPIASVAADLGANKDNCGEIPYLVRCKPGRKCEADQALDVAKIRAEAAKRPRDGAPFCDDKDSLVGVDVTHGRRVTFMAYHWAGYCYPSTSTAKGAIDEILKLAPNQHGGSCFTNGEAERLKSAVIGMLPQRIDRTLAVRYGFDAEGHYVDLQPGMRLRVEYGLYPRSSSASPLAERLLSCACKKRGDACDLRADDAVDKGVCEAVAADSKAAGQLKLACTTPELAAMPPDVDGGGFVGSGVVTYPLFSMSRTPAASIVVDPFVSGMTEFVPELRSGRATLVAGAIDLFETKAFPVARLYYGMVMRNFESNPELRLEASAVLVKATEQRELDRLHASFRGSLDRSPREKKMVEACNATTIRCAIFRQGGWPVPEILVTVNGVQQWVPLGATVRNMVEQVTDGRIDRDPARVPVPKLERLQFDAWFPVRGNPAELLDMPFVKGDRLSW